MSLHSQTAINKTHNNFITIKKNYRLMKILKHLPFELFFWITALILLGTADLHDQGGAAHFTLCPLASMGFTWCPGCGIGRAIAHCCRAILVPAWNSTGLGCRRY